MADKPWAQVLDEIYVLGGSAEFPSDETEGELDPDVDLSQRLDLDAETIQEAVMTLHDRRLACDKTVGLGEDETERYSVTLKSDGFQLAHDRDQSQRNRASNRAVTLLTLVLAFVGIAQATALASRASDMITEPIVNTVWAGAFIVLVATYFGLLKAGSLNFKGLNK